MREATGEPATARLKADTTYGTVRLKPDTTDDWSLGTTIVAGRADR